MNVGLFAMMAGFLLPLALSIRLAFLLAWERGRGWDHPLNLFLLIALLLAMVPVVALAPSAALVVVGRSIEDGAVLLDFTATRIGLAKLVVNIAGVLLTDAAMPRLQAQLTQLPVTGEMPTRAYLLRDLGVLAVCLLLALVAGALHR